MTDDELAGLPNDLVSQIRNVLSCKPPIAESEVVLRQLEDLLKTNETATQYYRGLRIKYDQPYYAHDRSTLMATAEKMLEDTERTSNAAHSAIDAIRRHERGARDR